MTPSIARLFSRFCVLALPRFGGWSATRALPRFGGWSSAQSAALPRFGGW